MLQPLHTAVFYWVEFMNNLVKQQNDVTIFEDGSAFISQRKLAEVLGIPGGTLFSYISRKHQNTNTINGLSIEIVESASTYFAFDTANPTTESKNFAKQIMKAGAKAYLYHEAGYEMAAVVPKPMTDMQMIIASAQAIEKLRETQAEQQKQLESITARLDFKEQHISVGLFLSRRGYDLTAGELAQEGKFMTKICTAQGLPMGKERSGRYDVNTYPEHVLLSNLSYKYPDKSK